MGNDFMYGGFAYDGSGNVHGGPDQYAGFARHHVMPQGYGDPAAIERFRSSINNRNITSDMSGAGSGQTNLTGEFLIKNTGEKRVQVDFPVYFTDKPMMTFGAEVQEGDVIVNGKFPTISVVVSRWITAENPPFSRFYLGCELAVVTTGAPTQKMIVHWQLSGNAFTDFDNGWWNTIDV